MTQTIKLVGLDCGSTTTSLVVASARLTTGALGRIEITQMEQVFRSAVVFTPFAGDRIDGARLESYLDEWLNGAQVRPEEIFGGGALITGLAAQRENAAAIAAWIESRMADAVIATADDPRLESWLAFMGNCHALSTAHPHTPILNLDIGGGTTNLAVGLDGQVIATGSWFVGARHFQFVPGTYQLTHVSPYATTLLEHLGIGRRVGETLLASEVESILQFYLECIEAAVEMKPESFSTTIGQRHVQAPLHGPPGLDEPLAVTLSGGVGQLVYDQLQGATPLGVTQFGDLGGELAARIAQSRSISGRMRQMAPEGLGRATVYGLLRHSTELSGATIHLPHPEQLPLKNVPIVGRVGPWATDEQLAQALELVARSVPAGCLQVELERQDLQAVRGLGNRLATLLAARPLARDVTLVLLVPSNLGKVLGGYITRWGTLDVSLIVVDEVPRRDAQFVRLGRLREGIVPLWLYAVR
jgi:ethanolamine utilization protein EutA